MTTLNSIGRRGVPSVVLAYKTKKMFRIKLTLTYWLNSTQLAYKKRPRAT